MEKTCPSFTDQAFALRWPDGLSPAASSKTGGQLSGRARSCSYALEHVSGLGRMGFALSQGSFLLGAQLCLQALVGLEPMRPEMERSAGVCRPYWPCKPTEEPTTSHTPIVCSSTNMKTRRLQDILLSGAINISQRNIKTAQQRNFKVANRLRPPCGPLRAWVQSGPLACTPPRLVPRPAAAAFGSASQTPLPLVALCLEPAYPGQDRPRWDRSPGESTAQTPLPPATRVTRCQHPDCPYSLLAAPPSKNAKPSVLLRYGPSLQQPRS